MAGCRHLHVTLSLPGTAPHQALAGWLLAGGRQAGWRAGGRASSLAVVHGTTGAKPRQRASLIVWSHSATPPPPSLLSYPLAGSGENAQPNTVSDLRYSSDSDSDSGADGVDSPPAAAAVAAVVEVPPPQSLLPAAPAVAVPPPQLLLMHAQAPPSDRKKNKKKNKDKAAVVAAAAAAPPARRQLHTPAMQQLLQQQTAAMHSQLEGVMQATLAMPVQLTFEQVQEALQRAIRTAAAEAVAAAAAQGPLSAADMEALVDAQVAEGQSIARQLHVAHVVAQGQARQEQQARQALQHARARQEQQARQALQQAQARRGKKK